MLIDIAKLYFIEAVVHWISLKDFMYFGEGKGNKKESDRNINV